MRINAGSAFHRRMTLIFDLLMSRSTLAEQLPYTVCLSSSVLIAQVLFLLEFGHTDTCSRTDATDRLRRQ